MKRFEAFDDGVRVIILTLGVLELKVPHAVEIRDLKPLLPGLSSHLLSFIGVGMLRLIPDRRIERALTKHHE